MTADSLVLLAPRWAQMWTLALAIYIGCKWVTWQRTAMGSVFLLTVMFSGFTAVYAWAAL